MTATSPRALRILLVEDDAGDRLLVERGLAQARGGAERFRLEHVAALQSALDRLAKGDLDALLLDLHLPDSRGVDTVTRVRDVDGRIPIVVFTSAGDETTALSALQAGAQDYLVKDELSGSQLRRAIRYAIERRRIRDENAALERRLAQAAKLESLGALAGGIAHDFNNLLTVIQLNAHRAEAELPARSGARSSLQAIGAAADVASRLTGELLAYTGRGPLEREVLDLSEAVRGAERILRDLVPDSVELCITLADPSPQVVADPSRLQQLLANLVLNAAAAIGDPSGRIEIATGAGELDGDAVAALAAGAPLGPGRYAYLEVRDDGCGMDEATMAKIFEPFFTARFAGRGLGLAAAHGIVRSHGGGIRVRSRAGEGSVFTAYLPLATSTSPIR